MNKAWAGFAARLALGLLFIVSGSSKLSAPKEEFAVVIESYGIVGADAANAAAALLPWAEVFAGFAVLLGFQTQLASAGAGAMLLVFILAIASTKARGIELPNCGCFGGRFHPKPSTTMLLDSAMLLVAGLAFVYGEAKLSLDNWARGGYTQRT